MKLSILGRLSNVQILIHTLFKGRFVGKDAYGNKYYKAKPRKGRDRDRRWVIYAKNLDASAVPAEWHGWLHHQTNNIPSETSLYRKDWITEHKANMTGTDEAYAPPGYEGKKRHKSTSDYVAWQP